MSNVRFIHISSWQIGSYLHQLDTIVKNNQLDKKFKLILLCPNFICSNNFVSTLYSKKIICFKNLFTYLLFLPFVHNPLISTVPWNFETQNKNSRFNKIHKDYYRRFKKENLSLNLKQLKNNFLKKRYKNTICIHLRDNYYEKSNTDRNVDIKTLNKTINFLLKKKFKIIRFINAKSKKITIKNRNYRELLVSSEKDKLKQFLIIDCCKLVIGSQSGILNYNLITKTPFLLTNAIPINNIMVIKKKDMYLFKKFKIGKKLLTISKMVQLNCHINPEKKKNKIKIINNSENEILNAVKEILNLRKIKINQKLKKKFNLSKNKIKGFNTNAQISKYFLLTNKEIFN